MKLTRTDGILLRHGRVENSEVVRVNPFAPGTATLCKLAAIAAKVEDALAGGSRRLDVETVRGLLADRGVQAFLDGMRTMSLLHEKREAENAEPD